MPSQLKGKGCSGLGVVYEIHFIIIFQATLDDALVMTKIGLYCVDIMETQTLRVTRAQIFLGNFKSLRALKWDAMHTHFKLEFNVDYIFTFQSRDE